jgi:tRNA dimethylallyltransferase
MRAIEIAIKLGKVPSLSIKKSPYKFIKIGLNLPQIQLDKKIEKRVRGMFEKGLLNEIKKLKKQGVSKKRFREFGFEYFNPTEKKVITSTIQYAKKQMTWFKRDKQIKWFKPNEYKEILNFLAEDLKDKR